jgi:hypothetical protein
VCLLERYGVTLSLSGTLDDEPKPDFGAVDYDRRGRGRSATPRQWSLDREVEDLADLIEATGPPAALYTSSFGAAIALWHCGSPHNPNQFGDVLLATTGTGVLGRYVLLPARRHGLRTYASLFPSRTVAGPLLLSAIPTRAVPTV